MFFFHLYYEAESVCLVQYYVIMELQCITNLYFAHGFSPFDFVFIRFFIRCLKGRLRSHRPGSQQAEGWHHPLWWTYLWQNRSSGKKKGKREGGGGRDEMRTQSRCWWRGINVNLGLQSPLDCTEFIFVSESFKATFQTPEPHMWNDLPWVWWLSPGQRRWAAGGDLQNVIRRYH